MADENQSDAQLEESLSNVNLATQLDDSQSTQTDTSGDTAATNAENDGADTQSKPNEKQEDTSKSDADTTEAKDDATGQKTDEQNQNDGQQEQQTDQTQDRERQARQAWLERQRTRNEVANQVDQFYGPKTQEQLVEEGMNPNDARVEAMEQQINFERERGRVAELNATMRAEAAEIFHDFPVFDEKSPDFDPQFAKEVEEQYRIASRVQTDENGIVLNAEVPLYSFYQRAYNIYNRGTSRGIQQKQDATAAMQSRVEDPGGSSSTNQAAPGSLEEMEQRLGDVVIT